MKYLPIAFVICGLAANLSASTITILNPNFDAQVLAPGTATGSGAGFNPITDWNQNDVVNTGYSVYNPVATSYPGGVPGGNNVADVFSDGTTASIGLHPGHLHAIHDQLYHRRKPCRVRTAIGDRIGNFGYRVSLRTFRARLHGDCFERLGGLGFGVGRSGTCHVRHHGWRVGPLYLPFPAADRLVRPREKYGPEGCGFRNS